MTAPDTGSRYRNGRSAHPFRARPRPDGLTASAARGVTAPDTGGRYRNGRSGYPFRARSRPRAHARAPTPTRRG
ncbi:hypothetical protein, partial [Cryobacterium frigoriphilum]|uniref:hypothetical protein n=1 Tax=Cryobacterium frigoriphilum TaxID=1259150 RepID=UPI001A7EB1A6